MTTNVSVIIPSFNERTRLPRTLSDIESFCLQYEQVNEVIVVDDCSKDQTVERAMYYNNRIPGFRIIRLAENQGKWGALKEGILQAKNDRVLLMDADGSASIWELQTISEDDEYAYFGSRFMSASIVQGKSISRTIISHGYRMYVRFWYWYACRKTDIDDMQCPFKVFSKSKLQNELQTKQYTGDIELALKLNQPVKNFPIQFVHMAGSNISISDIFRMAIDTAKIAIEWHKHFKEKGTH